LLNALYADDTQVRYAAVLALGQMRSEAAVPDLIKRLNDEAYTSETGKRVCDAAATALERINTKAATSAIKGWRGRH